MSTLRVRVWSSQPSPQPVLHITLNHRNHVCVELGGLLQASNHRYNGYGNKGKLHHQNTDRWHGNATMHFKSTSPHTAVMKHADTARKLGYR